jgi:hypothetical protein
VVFERLPASLRQALARDGLMVPASGAASKDAVESFAILVAVGKETLMKLQWYESNKNSLCVYFPGGFQLYVICEDKVRKKTNRWRVWWSDNGPKIKGLSDVWFKTPKEAQRAAEAIFVPMVEISRRLVEVTVTVSAKDALLKSTDKPKKLKPRRKL